MGLLQLMPGTSRQVGVRDPYDPEANVRGAVDYLEWLEGIWDDIILDPVERRKFIIASYNTGAGHVGDARRLTAKYGGDDTKWDDVAFWLLKKSERRYYRDPVVKYGYARGLEPVTYVAKILDRYEHYVEFVEGNEDAALGAASNTTAAL
jgi:membrane-bound lytic murein transglycosylase F